MAAAWCIEEQPGAGWEEKVAEHEAGARWLGHAKGLGFILRVQGSGGTQTNLAFIYLFIFFCLLFVAPDGVHCGEQVQCL